MDLVKQFFEEKRSLYKHHLDSFDDLLGVKIKRILLADVNRIIVSDVKKFSIEYKDIWVLRPEITENF